ncbi:MAG: GNAT family N-acetyltransferase [Chloroflexota bacterium]
MISIIEELSFNAWPALQTLHYDGWLLRFADGYTRRANSVNPLYASTLPISEKLVYCEEIYRRQGSQVVFKIAEATQPNNLDAALQSEGYVLEAPTSVQLLDLREYDTDPLAGLTTHLTDEWLNAYFALNERNERYRPVMKRMLDQIIPATCFLTLQADNQTIAVGLGVLERGYLGLYDIVTAASHRRTGVGTQLMQQLLAWGKANGAQQAYLQVMQENIPAQHLYAKLGFQESYRYWYRVKASRTSGS